MDTNDWLMRIDAKLGWLIVFGVALVVLTAFFGGAAINRRGRD